MSIGSLGIIGGLAGTALPQRAAEADRVQREAGEQTRAAEAGERAENAPASARPRRTRKPASGTPTAGDCGKSKSRPRKNPRTCPLTRHTFPLRKTPAEHVAGNSTGWLKGIGSRESAIGSRYSYSPLPIPG